MLDLYNIQYDRDTLKRNIYSLRFVDIVKTQKLDYTFIVRYILNKKYQLHEEDILSLNEILKYQIHIDQQTLLNMLYNYDSDEDSVEDFESFSNK